MPMQIAVIDDDGLFRQGIKSVLVHLDGDAQITEFPAVLEADDDRGRYDLILLDYHIPGSSFERNLLIAKSTFADAKIVIVSADESAEKILRAIDLGAAGFIPKSSDPAVLIAALKLVLADQVYLPAQLMSFQSANSKTVELAYQSLSDAQKRVLNEALKGKANKVIAIDLDLAIGTVKSHLSSAYRVLGVNNRTDAVVALSQIPELTS
ncbi:MAG: response regulator transcription factor [Pseudomonadota bacterium]